MLAQSNPFFTLALLTLFPRHPVRFTTHKLNLHNAQAQPCLNWAKAVYFIFIGYSWACDEFVELCVEDTNSNSPVVERSERNGSHTPHTSHKAT